MLTIKLTAKDYHSAMYYMGRAFEGCPDVWKALWADLH